MPWRSNSRATAGSSATDDPLVGVVAEEHAVIEIAIARTERRRKACSVDALEAIMVSRVCARIRPAVDGAAPVCGSRRVWDDSAETFMFDRPLVTYAFDSDPKDGIDLCRALAPGARTIRVALRVRATSGVVLGADDLRRLEENLEQADRAIRLLRESLKVEGIEVVGEPVPGVALEPLTASFEADPPDVVVFGAFGETEVDDVAGFALELTRRTRIPSAVGRVVRSPIEHVVLPFDGRAASLVRLGPFLRDRCDASHRVTFLALGPREASPKASDEAIEAITGIRSRIDTASISDSLLAQSQGVERGLAAAAPDLVVVPTELGRGFAPAILRAMFLRSIPGAQRPVLFVKAAHDAAHELAGELEAFDAIAFGKAVVRLERRASLGAPIPLTDPSIALIVSGEMVDRVACEDGVVRIPDSLEGPIGLGRDVDARDPLLALETAVEVVRSPASRLALVDARLDAASLANVRDALERDDRLLVAVRTVVDQDASAIRERLRLAGWPRPLVVDVRDILDEGPASDVPPEVAGVRLARAAARLRTEGASLDAVVVGARTRARGHGFAIFTADALDGADALAREAFAALDADLGSRLDALTGSTEVPGNSVRIVLENDEARRGLIDLLDHATVRFHGQWYIVEDDEVGREIEAAMVRASERGVAVRVLVDALYSRHESFGVTNPLLDRLGRVPGISVRARSPIAFVPDLEDLKRRDHRKLVIVDGVHGVVSGRNLGKTYFRSFAEVALASSSSFRDVPWLDASARLDGPVVTQLDACFRKTWIESGGDPFELLPAPAAGGTAVRFVVHEGLSDAFTLEAYLALIDGARERLVVVNSFPLQLEVQHAMLRAIARGVRLSLLVGHVRPVYRDGVPFTGGAYRSVADALVRSRIAALLAVGADVREFVVAGRPGWDESLGVVRPYVHAKLLCADRCDVAVGSANLDVTAGYWESEALVIVRDEALGRSVDERLDEWLASAEPIDPESPAWLAHAELRAWLGRVWPSFLG